MVCSWKLGPADETNTQKLKPQNIKKTVPTRTRSLNSAEGTNSKISDGTSLLVENPTPGRVTPA